jgi:two-component system, LytTR family, sensor kinase
MRDDDTLVLSVADDGEAMDNTHSGGNGIGLANVRDRLEARYKSTAVLNARAVPKGGYIARLTLPLSHRMPI